VILPTLAAALATRWASVSALVALEAQVSRGAPLARILEPGNYLFAEYDGTPDSTADSRFAASPADLAATSIQESGEIVCSAMAQRGDGDMAACEADALAMVGAVIADLAADRTVGGVVHNAEVTTGSASQLQNGQGVAVIVPFTVAYFGTYAASAA
jgi:alcohol dehydrogenase class IV